MQHRIRKAAVFVVLMGGVYGVKLLGDHAPAWFVGMGSAYDCGSDQFYSGERCTRRTIAVFSPPCPPGWRTGKETCVWGNSP